MSSAWLLPEHIADVLPLQAGRIEASRRVLLDMARSYGFELVIPPLFEYIESLLTGTGHELDLKTFKLIDQLSGRTLGIRADTTPQVARIDAHLLNREGVARLCYCGPVLHALPSGLQSSREPLQFGAEIYGHAGIEADLEILELAIDGLKATGISDPVIDLGDARIVRGVLAGAVLDARALETAVDALVRKDASAIADLSTGLGTDVRAGLISLLSLYGGVEVLDEARRRLPARALIAAALDDLAALAGHLRRAHPELRVGFDLGDMSGYAYYSGLRFAVYRDGVNDALVRGGRYDEVGAVFGRNRPAVGFSLDLKPLAATLPQGQRRTAIVAPWRADERLGRAIRSLRSRGEIVLCLQPGEAPQDQEFEFDRELVEVDSQWVLQPRSPAATASLQHIAHRHEPA